MIGDLSDLAWPQHTARLTLRPLTVDDAEAVHGFRSLPEVVAYLSHGVLTMEETRARVAARVARGRPGAERPQLALAVCDRETGAVIGDAAIGIRLAGCITAEGTTEREGTLGYVLHPSVQGIGLGTELAAALLEIGFGQMGLRRITADVFADAVPSARLLRRLGLRQERRAVASVLGRDGRWLDDLTFCHAPRRVARARWRVSRGRVRARLQSPAGISLVAPKFA
ncbi:GNAT family N-acetyltransferase [Segeticoccus rhizosphaerae]|uniref:GNAT family N-acetyltransferase n=1 Tax=Segeticoccus rhizosphaerae TaxID=1104777 RepID=UPI0010C13458|nr:GNAT family N-acetyltransferase [Ornithinicoccus soli]